MKKYIITWITKRNRQEVEHEKVIEAENAKAAREAFDDWRLDKEGPHAFRIKVKLLK